MQITSLCPFRVSTLAWEAQPQQRSLSVVVKATFAFTQNGEARVAARQEPLGGDRHWDDHPMASLFAPADEVPLKRRVDVVLVGHAYAPGRAPTVSLVARLTVGDALSKSVRVTGDRLWEAAEGGGLRLGGAKSFLRLPLRYERAPLSAENPVGIDDAAMPVLGAPARPNLEPIDDGGMIGFGPVASTWRARRSRVDDGGLFWAFGVSSGVGPQPGPPPPGFDFAFFNAAPVEQQVDLLRAGTRIELENMNPEHALLTTTLPAMRPQAFLVPPGKSRGEEVVLRCDTLWIDCDRELIVLTFRGVADAGDRDPRELGALVVAADPGGKKLRWDAVQRALAGSGSVAETSAAGGEGDPLARRYDAVIEGPADDARTLATPPSSRSARVSPPAPPQGPPRPPAASPFTPRSPNVAAAPRPGGAPRPASPAPFPPPPTRDFAAAPAPPPVVAPVVEEETTTTAGRSARSEAPENPTSVVTVDDDEREPTRAPWAGAPADPRPPTPPPVSSSSRVDPTLVGRYAAASAHLARKGVDRAEVLAAHGLDEDEIFAMAQTYSRLLASETEAGQQALTSAFDVAYVTAQEMIEPRVGLPEYARVVAALERGEVGRALAELDLELADLMRLQRVWTRRTASSPDLAAELDAAVDAARRASHTR